ncbi:hypothetical protein P4U07_32975 [Bacillus mycoides]|nr:hypothetical protein [Bacillus mycoides]
MIKKETFELLKAISALYPIFEVTQMKIDLGLLFYRNKNMRKC